MGVFAESLLAWAARTGRGDTNTYSLNLLYLK